MGFFLNNVLVFSRTFAFSSSVNLILMASNMLSFFILQSENREL